MVLRTLPQKCCQEFAFVKHTTFVKDPIFWDFVNIIMPSYLADHIYLNGDFFTAIYSQSRIPVFIR